jgi:hypothetical protein
MKKIFSFIYAGAILLVLTSCKDFLEKNPLDQISSQIFWNTEEDVQIGLTGIYSIMPYSNTFNHSSRVWDGLSDIVSLPSSYWTVDIGTFNRGLVNSSTGGIFNEIFSQCYIGISKCNIFLENFQKAAGMSETNKLKYKGEALFLRSYFYFILTESYGGVPLYTKPPSIEESKVKQSTKDAVVNQILSDLDEAIANLPDIAYTGHAVKGSALALKAKVLMHNQKWVEAASAANKIISSGVFSLYNNYTNLFIPEGQSNNPEIMFSVMYLSPDADMFENQNNASGQKYNANTLTVQGKTIQPLKRAVDAFECIDGLPINQSPLYDAKNQFKNRDPRLAYSIMDSLMFDTKMRTSGQTASANYFAGVYTGYVCVKGASWNKLMTTTTRYDQDFIVLRYADVLLMYAECKNEVSGPDQSVYDAVNLVRGRPSVNMPPLPPGLNKDAMRGRIRNERLVELGFEGRRFWDLLRWRTAETIIPTVKDLTGYFRTFDPSKMYLFPISFNELKRNSNLIQNPGYN